MLHNTPAELILSMPDLNQTILVLFTLRFTLHIIIFCWAIHTHRALRFCLESASVTSIASAIAQHLSTPTKKNHLPTQVHGTVSEVENAMHVNLLIRWWINSPFSNAGVWVGIFRHRSAIPKRWRQQRFLAGLHWRPPAGDVGASVLVLPYSTEPLSRDDHCSIGALSYWCSRSNSQKSKWRRGLAWGTTGGS